MGGIVARRHDASFSRLLPGWLPLRFSLFLAYPPLRCLLRRGESASSLMRPFALLRNSSRESCCVSKGLKRSSMCGWTTINTRTSVRPLQRDRQTCHRTRPLLSSLQAMPVIPWWYFPVFTSDAASYLVARECARFEI